jgi:adenine/guanine phosphoribosyltransferase-like PRPP-binding protein
MNIPSRLTDRDVKKHVSSIINQMVRANFKPDIVIGLSRGGIVPALLVSHYFNCECYIRNKEESLFDVEFPQRSILVIDDINDSGNTLTAVNHELYQDLELREIKYASLINNESSSFTVDFSGIDFNRLEQDDWFDFPWEKWWAS